MWVRRLLTETPEGQGQRASRGQGTGADSGYYLRSGQPRHTQPRGQGRPQGRRCGQQGQTEVVGAGDDIDGHGVDISSGSGTEDSDGTLKGDDPVGAVRGRHSLIGDTVTPELRHTRLAGDLLITEEQRLHCAAAAGDNEIIDGVTPHSSCLSSDVNRSDVDIGVKPHSSCLSSDVNCSDSVDYSRIQRVMDMVRHHREDDDDVTLLSWRQLVQRVDGRCRSNSPSDGPNHPAETYDNRSSGKVYELSRPVKHTRFRYDRGYYADDPVDEVYTTGEYDECRVERTQGSGECQESCVLANSVVKRLTPLRLCLSIVHVIMLSCMRVNGPLHLYS